MEVQRRFQVLQLHAEVQTQARTPPPPAAEQLPLHAGRFNERLVLSLAATKACLFLDDELNILPTSAEGQTAPLPDGAALGVQPQDPELKELCDSLADTQVPGALLATPCGALMS